MSEASENLQIPNHIYGRENELAVFQEALQWASLGSTELVIVTGQPGVGKSALVQEAFKSMVIGKSYFASGKFDQYNAGIPYEPFVKCFQIMIRKLLTEPESMLQKWTTRVKKAVGPNGAVITKVIPEARLLLGEFPPSEDLPAMEARHRFEWAFHRFVQVFTRADHPLVLFFDDMQWADDASLQLLHSLIVDPESQNLLVIAAYREQEWKENVNPFEKWLQGAHAGYSVRQVSLGPLEFGHIQQMVADSLHCEPGECLEVAHALYGKSIGNPLYVKQLLKSAYDEQGIRLNPANGVWECDSEVLGQLPELHGQFDYWTDRILAIPVQSRELLAIGACLGSKFKARLLSAVSGISNHETAKHMASALQEGLLIAVEDHESIRHYQFTHDRIQQAAYSLLDSRRLMEIHLSAGRLLMEHEASADKEQVLYDIANHFNHALDLLTAEEREMIVRLNEEAGRKAMESSAYSTALRYFKKGIACLPEDFWSRRFDFTFQLHLRCFECEYLCGQFERADAGLNVVLKRARNWKERAQVYKLKIEQYSNAGKYSQSIGLGLRALREVGIRISERPQKLMILKEIVLTKRLLEKRIEELSSLPEIVDPQAKAMLELLVSLMAPTFFSNREVFAVIASKFIRLVYKYGGSSAAPSFIAAYGMLLGTVLGHYQMGYRLGKIAIELADRAAVASVRCKVYVMFYGVISPWVRYDREDEGKLEYAAKLGLEAGDYVYASYAVGSLINLSYVRHAMDQIVKVNRKNLQIMEHTKEELVFKNALIYMDLAKRLGSPRGDVFSLTDGRTSDSEAEFLEDMMKDEGGAVTLYQIYTYKTQIFYLFGRYPEAVRFAKQANPYERLSAHAPHLSEHHYYEALSIAAAWDNLPAGEKSECSRRLKRRHRQFKAWDRMSPENFRHKFLLIQAEIARLKGSEKKIIDLYDRSIQFARERNYVQYQAVACELAGKYHLQKGRERIARGYLQEAYEAYGAWGAESKRSWLREQYPCWLNEPVSGNGEVTATAADADAVTAKQQADEESSLTADDRALYVGESFSRETDLAAIVKASLSLSQGMDFKEILRKLMMIILEAANAQKGCLLVQKNEKLWVEFVVHANGEWANDSRALNESGEVPVSMMQYVSRLEETVQLSDASQDDLFQSDPYIKRNQTKTVCCVPLALQDQFSGLLYLENNGHPCLFADSRIATLRIMGSQALFVWKLFDSFGETPDSTMPQATKSEEPSIDSLTDRELEVLNLMALGMTNKEIAFQLGVTAGTIKVHVHNIFSKLNVNRRTKAIAEAKKKKML